MRESATPFWECVGLRAIPVSGYVKRNGACAMASPAGYEAIKRIPGIEYVIGGFFDQPMGPRVDLATDDILVFPYKPGWDGGPDFAMIQESLEQLIQLVEGVEVFLARPGVGRGGMPWEHLRFLFAEAPDNIVLVPHV